MIKKKTAIVKPLVKQFMNVPIGTRTVGKVLCVKKMENKFAVSDFLLTIS